MTHTFSEKLADCLSEKTKLMKAFKECGLSAKNAKERRKCRRKVSKKHGDKLRSCSLL